MNQPSEELSAQEAADLLGVKLRTLYAYVSRGQLQSLPGKGRARRYLRADVERLRAGRGSRGASSVGGPRVGDALRWGEPVLDSAITQVSAGGPLYRGRSAVELARAGVSFEAAAELLWLGSLPETASRWPIEGLGASASRLGGLLPEGVPPLSLLAVLVPALAARDPGRFDRRPQAVLPRARALIRRMAAGLGLSGGAARLRAALAAEGVAESLAVALGLELTGKRRAEAVRALDQGLIVWADHELNVSSFAARVAASADSDLYSCVSAGLGALAGPRHGAACDRIEAVLAEIARPERAEQVLFERERRGERIPGFGHPLYPQGDPRALPLLETAAEVAPRSRRVRSALALVEAMRARGHEPTIDVGIVTLTAALDLPAGAAPGLVAVGRCAGWIAHVLEQYAADFLIRPRARYRSVPESGPGAS